MRRTLFGFLAIATCSATLALAQAPAGAPPSGPVESRPLPAPPGAAIAPPSPGIQAPTPASPPPAAAPPQTAQPGAPPSSGAPLASTARPTLVPDAGGDQTDVAEVTLPAKPAAIISGTSGTDEGFANVRQAIQKVEGELTKAGISPAGRPFTIFQQFNPDNSFNYDVVIPIAAAPEGRTTLTPEIRFGTTPAGRALRFVHKGAYEDVDSTYDMIEIYLEAKGIVVKDPIIEEYVNDPKDVADVNLELNIFVQPQ